MGGKRKDAKQIKYLQRICMRDTKLHLFCICIKFIVKETYNSSISLYTLCTYMYTYIIHIFTY